MPHHQSARSRRPVMAYLIITLAASVAALITALWPATSQAGTLAP